VKDISLVPLRLDYSLHRPDGEHFAAAAEAGDRIALRGQGQHLVRDFIERPIFAESEINDKAGEPWTYGHANCAARAFFIVNARGVVDI
jgi:hypothetical protein